MAERTLAMRLTSGRLAAIRVWPTPIPGLLIAKRPAGGWVIACESDRTCLGTFADPEAALACVTEIGPLACWDLAGNGRLRLPMDIIRRIAAIVARWGGGEIDIAERADG